MNSSIVNMLWIGTNISPIEALSMKSFLKNGMHVKLHAYNLLGGVPHDVELCDANLIIPQKEIFKHLGSYAAFADLFRWKLMYEHGDYYADADVVCLKRLKFDESVVIGWEIQDERIASSVLGFDKSEHPLAKRMLENALNPLEIRPYDSFKIKKRKWLKRLSFIKTHAIGWGDTSGPIGLNNEYNLREDHYGINPVAQSAFHKIASDDWRMFIEPNVGIFEHLKKESFAVHLCNEMWRRNGIDKYKPFPKTSFIGEAMERYW